MKRLAIALLTLPIFGGALAQSNVAIVVDRLQAACPSGVKQILDDASFSKMTSVRPIAVTAVCVSAMNRIESDSKFRRNVNVSEAAANELLTKEPFQAYLSILAMTSIFGCLLPELEITKDSILLPR